MMMATQNDSVKDIMSEEVTTLSPNKTLSDALYWMNNERIGSITITENNTVVGIITRSDLRRYSGKDFTKIKLKEAMSKTIYSIASDTSIEETEKIMNKKHIGSILVIDDDKLKGIVTRYDLRTKITPKHISPIKNTKPQNEDEPAITEKSYGAIKTLFGFLLIIGIIAFFIWYYLVPIVPIWQEVQLRVAAEVNGQANPGFPYWTTKTITYSFSSTNLCNNKQLNNIIAAFNILQNETNGSLSFTESSNGRLIIRCHDTYDPLGASAWAGPELYPGNVITGGTIDFYKIQFGHFECQTYPHLELHEILHTLGFEDDFSSNKGIMYFGRNGEYWDPCNHLDAKIADCLKNIYSNGEQGSSCAGIPHKEYGVQGTSIG